MNATIPKYLYVQSVYCKAESALPKPWGSFPALRRQKWLALVTLVFVLAMPHLADAQTGAVQPLITARVDDSVATVLPGNTHPLARAEFDRGAAPASLAMDHMLLVLKRSPAQEAALETLLAQQQDKSSPNYHNWLTPEQFGQQFGPSDQDVQTITSWLQSQGFQNVNVANGRTTIDFSGTAGQVQTAFHTSIHKYVLANGEEHWANSSDPQIPAALSGAIAGVHSLNNFPRKPLHQPGGVVRRSSVTGKYSRVSPDFTFGPFSNGCNGANSNCYGIGPGDIATIYNIPSTINGAMAGTGQTIAIVSDSDIFASDVTQFRSVFNLPAINFNQIETGADPGVVFSGGSGDELEAIIDVEWSGATAPGATVDLVVSPSTNSTFGGDTSAAYIVNCQTTGPNCPVAVPASVISSSYNACELSLGTSGNQFYNTEWQQASAEGITVVVATGDSGSAGCDPQGQGPAQFGLAVNGIASTPYNTAVGGTDFNDFTNPTTYFSNTPGTLSSALSYIPENPYNDTCTNPTIFGFFSLTAEQACNNANIQNDGLVVAAGGGGGVSNCTTPNGAGPSNCSGGYAKPFWQQGPGVPADGSRDVPDVSLFAGDGTLQNFYVYCESDLLGLQSSAPPAPCSLASPFQDFLTSGGTSFGVQAFAGIVALIDQKQGSRLGNLNPLLYSLAAGSSSASIFHDVTTGSIAMPCVMETGVTGCTINTMGDAVGVLNGYSAGTGYDQATGLGSLNVANLVNAIGAALSNPPFGSLDAAKNAGNGSSTIAQAGSLHAVGWAVDPVLGAPVSQVQVLLDKVLLGNATLGLSRPDVAAAYKNASFTNSGWTYTGSIGTPSPGSHQVSAVAFDSSGVSATIGTAAITVTAPPPFGSLDAAKNAGNGNSTIAQGGSLQAIGWAVDPVFGAPVSQVQVLIDGIALGNATLGISRPDVATAYNNPSFTNSGWTFTANIGSPSPGTHQVSVIAIDSSGVSATIGTAAITVTAAPSSYLFVPVTPCRIADTRNAAGAFGGPALAAQSSRNFVIPSSSCGITSTAAAYSLNVTVVPRGPLGYITMWPTGQSQPLVSTLNSLDGRVKANAAIVPAGTAGAVSVFATDATDVVLDINGYFVPPAANPAPLAFYPLTPCRLVDTRNPAGPLAGPSLIAGQARTFPLQSGSCNVPSNAQAYSLNFTAVSPGPLGFLTVWPAGQAQPLVSTLNAPTGTVTANAAIVPAGTGGSINTYVTNNTDMIIDINGYFAPPGAGGLSLFSVTPCRVLDTRVVGAGQPFTGAMNVNVSGSACSVPTAAQAYVFNATVVPPALLGFLTLWPQGAAQPVVSTLNAYDAAITSNMAIVSTTNGSVSAFSSNSTQLLLDISGYFAPGN